MVGIRKLVIFLFLVMLLTACQSQVTQTSTEIIPVTPINNQTGYPYPGTTDVPIVQSEYPGPGDGSGINATPPTLPYHVDKLEIPTPTNGKAVITGQLLEGGVGGKPFMTTLYLASTLPPSTPDYPPLISFSEEGDPIALQEIGTGRFLFTDVEPGQYALIIWSPFGGNPVVDANDATLLFTVKPGETKDLGIIPIK